MHCSRTHARTKCRRRILPVLTGLGMYTSTNHTSSTIWSRQILSKSVMGSAIMGVMRRDPARREACGARTACTLRVDSEPPRPAAVLCKRGKHRAMQGTCQSDNNNQAPRKPLRGLTAPAPALTRRHSPHWVGLRFLHGGHGSGDRPEQGGVAAGAIRLRARSQMHAMHECCTAARRQQAASLRPCSPRCDEALRRAGGLEAGGATCVGGAAQIRGAESRHHGEG